MEYIPVATEDWQRAQLAFTVKWIRIALTCLVKNCAP